MTRRPRIDISGATALEFALCAPAFFMLVMGIIEVGLLVWMQLSAVVVFLGAAWNAEREDARLASANGR